LIVIENNDMIDCVIQPGDQMSDFQTEMNRLVSGFVNQISTLARQAAIDTLERALANGHGGHSDGARRRGEKRSSDELDELATEFYDFVLRHPGLRIEQINKQLDTTTRDLMLPIRKMIADGALKTKGTRRSTTYFAVEKRRGKKAA
jgi:hypothetical protein